MFKQTNTLEAAQLIRITCPDLQYDAGTETCQCSKKLIRERLNGLVIQVIIPLLSITEGSFFTIELSMN